MTALPPDNVELDAWLARREAGQGLREGCAERILWAGAPGAITDVAVLYLHGFSASALELSPLPEQVAAALGANLVLNRLTGHGQDGAAMARATLADWRADTARALALARRVGRRVMVLSCSTGSTLLVPALAEGERPWGVVMLSPNFGLASRFGQAVLDLPLARLWAPLVAGRMIDIPVQSPAHAAGWTTRYPVNALYPMADAVRLARRADLSAIPTPAFFAFADADRVVNARATHRVMARWGGRVEHLPLQPGPGDDPYAHLMAGLFSPARTAPLTQAIVTWSRGLDAAARAPR